MILGAPQVPAFLISSVPDPESGAFFIPGSGMDKKPISGSGVNILHHIFESLETIFWVKILKFFDADPGIFLTLNPGWKNSDPGWKNSDPG
jgi:hypothetical protein